MFAALPAMTGALLTGCYDTPRPTCGFTCGANGACPDGYSCNGFGRCQVTSAAEDECPGVDAMPAAVDARVDTPDARVDAPIDAPPSLCPDLDPASDGSGRQALLIAEISPTVFLELFNDTAAPIALAEGGWALQARAATYLLAELATAVIVPAHGYATVPWPAALGSGDAGGELALYSGIAAAPDFDDATKLVGYACWGTDAEIARKPLAETAGKWTGACAAALTMSALRRKPAVAGTAAAHFDTALAADPTNCEP